MFVQFFGSLLRLNSVCESQTFSFRLPGTVTDEAEVMISDDVARSSRLLTVSAFHRIIDSDVSIPERGPQGATSAGLSIMCTHTPINVGSKKCDLNIVRSPQLEMAPEFIRRSPPFRWGQTSDGRLSCFFHPSHQYVIAELGTSKCKLSVPERIQYSQNPWFIG